jgi:neurofibromin 1
VLVANGSSIHDLVITGIAHILNKNSESAKNLCLAKLSDDNLRIRVIFMRVFTRILHQGARFNPTAAKAENKKDGLCQVRKTFVFKSTV